MSSQFENIFTGFLSDMGPWFGRELCSYERERISEISSWEDLLDLLYIYPNLTTGPDSDRFYPKEIEHHSGLQALKNKFDPDGDDHFMMTNYDHDPDRSYDDRILVDTFYDPEQRNPFDCSPIYYGKVYIHLSGGFLAGQLIKTLARYPNILETNYWELAFQQRDRYLEERSEKLAIERESCALQKKRSSRCISLTKRAEIFSRDRYRCQHCGINARDGDDVRLEIDHKMPVAKGGSNELQNLQLLCFDCNRGKSDKCA